MIVDEEHCECVTVAVELFGNARLLAGRRKLDVDVARDCNLGSVAASIARRCPALVGTVIRQDLSGFLDSYTVNLNGVEFITDDHRDLNGGDSLLLFSSQAGG